jgi:hypothetical protein
VIGVKRSCGKTEPNHQSMFGDNSPDRTFLKVDVAWSIDIDIAALKRLVGGDILLLSRSANTQWLTYDDAAYECNNVSFFAPVATRWLGTCRAAGW